MAHANELLLLLLLLLKFLSSPSVFLFFAPFSMSMSGMVVNQGCTAERGLGRPHKNNLTRLEEREATEAEPLVLWSEASRAEADTDTLLRQSVRRDVHTCGKSATCLEGFSKSPFLFLLVVLHSDCLVRLSTPFLAQVLLNLRIDMSFRLSRRSPRI